MLKEEKTGGKKFMDFGGEILPYAAANNIKVCRLGQTCMCQLCLGLCTHGMQPCHTCHVLAVGLVAVCSSKSGNGLTTVVEI